MEALQAQAKVKGATGLPGGRQLDDSPGMSQSQNETFDMARQRGRAQEAWKENQAKGRSAASGDDGMSPTGGAFGAEFVNVAAVSSAMMSDDQARKSQEPRQDAFTTQEEAKPVQSGSAWERLRQQATSGKPVQPARRDTSSSGDSFSFSSTDEDRQLAKAEAQKDFDSRIERERSGEEFEES